MHTSQINSMPNYEFVNAVNRLGDNLSAGQYLRSSEEGIKTEKQGFWSWIAKKLLGVKNIKEDEYKTLDKDIKAISNRAINILTNPQAKRALGDDKFEASLRVILGKVEKSRVYRWDISKPERTQLKEILNPPAIRFKEEIVPIRGRNVHFEEETVATRGTRQPMTKEEMARVQEEQDRRLDSLGQQIGNLKKQALRQQADLTAGQTAPEGRAAGSKKSGKTEPAQAREPTRRTSTSRARAEEGLSDTTRRALEKHREKNPPKAEKSRQENIGDLQRKSKGLAQGSKGFADAAKKLREEMEGK